LTSGTGVDAAELKNAIERMHDCRAQLHEIVTVYEQFQGRPVWEGIVHVFDLEAHPTATRAYAWSSPIEGSDKRRFYAVLHVPPISSPADAVRAAIVADWKATGNGS
jgi:hypothetical protein